MKQLRAPELLEKRQHRGIGMVGHIETKEQSAVHIEYNICQCQMNSKEGHDKLDLFWIV